MSDKQRQALAIVRSTIDHCEAEDGSYEERHNTALLIVIDLLDQVLAQTPMTGPASARAALHANCDQTCKAAS